MCISLFAKNYGATDWKKRKQFPNKAISFCCTKELKLICSFFATRHPFCCLPHWLDPYNGDPMNENYPFTTVDITSDDAQHEDPYWSIERLDCFNLYHLLGLSISRINEWMNEWIFNCQQAFRLSFWPIFGSFGIRKDFIQEKIRLHKEEEAIGVGRMAHHGRKLSQNTRWHQENNMCVMNHT